MKDNPDYSDWHSWEKSKRSRRRKHNERVKIKTMKEKRNEPYKRSRSRVDFEDES